MSRVYLILQLTGGLAPEAIHDLQRKPGVVMADVLEEPDKGVMVVVEAPGRLKLAENVIQVIAAVDTVTEDLRLLPAREN